MKSYEEMTDAVLLRAGKERIAQKRRQKSALTVGVCMCVAALALLAGIKFAMPTSGSEGQASRISVFCVTANASQQQQMLVGEKTPYNAVIRVHDITGLDETQLLELRNADKAYARELAKQSGNDDPGNPNWSISSPISGQTMVSTIYIGSYYLSVEDYSQVRDVSAETTENGWCALHLADYDDTSVRDSIGITWSLSGTGVDKIAENPKMRLSEIRDMITVTVEFMDGTKETVHIDIAADDAGKLYGTFRGTTFGE